MDSGRRKRNTFVQCQTCGKIYQISCEVKIDTLYITAECSECGHLTGLNLGDKEEEIYELYNVNVDPRYY